MAKGRKQGMARELGSQLKANIREARSESSLSTGPGGTRTIAPRLRVLKSMLSWYNPGEAIAKESPCE